jgi:hypothetical protein
MGKKGKKGRDPEVFNLLDLKPLRAREWVDLDEERLAIVQPRFTNKVAKKIFRPLLKNPDIRIRLDDFGSFVWRQCDGKSTVREIAVKLREHFGDAVEPAIDRLELFLKDLERYEFISFSNIKELAGTGEDHSSEEKSPG